MASNTVKSIALCAILLLMLGVLYVAVNPFLFSIHVPMGGILEDMVNSVWIHPARMETQINRADLYAGEFFSVQEIIGETGVSAEYVEFLCAEDSFCNSPDAPLEIDANGIRVKKTVFNHDGSAFVVCSYNGKIKVVIGFEYGPTKAFAEIACGLAQPSPTPPAPSPHSWGVAEGFRCFNPVHQAYQEKTLSLSIMKNVLLTGSARITGVIVNGTKGELTVGNNGIISDESSVLRVAVSGLEQCHSGEYAALPVEIQFDVIGGEAGQTDYGTISGKCALPMDI